MIKPKRSKYGNSKIVVDGIKFDSKREYKRYTQLKLLEQIGEITDLQLQVPFVLIPDITEEVEVVGKKGITFKTKTIQRKITYITDFVYFENGVKIVEDVKISPKMLPPEYKIKKKLLRYFHGIEIREWYG